jgi:hypothetical protein
LGIEKNSVPRFKRIKLSAAVENSFGQSLLGLDLEFGRETANDLRGAFENNKLSAEQENLFEQSNDSHYLVVDISRRKSKTSDPSRKAR